jgi:predicted anti-sigma-YlaC factor YlaD
VWSLALVVLVSARAFAALWPLVTSIVVLVVVTFWGCAYIGWIYRHAVTGPGRDDSRR